MVKATRLAKELFSFTRAPVRGILPQRTNTQNEAAISEVVYPVVLSLVSGSRYLDYALNLRYEAKEIYAKRRSEKAVNPVSSDISPEVVSYLADVLGNMKIDPTSEVTINKYQDVDQVINRSLVKGEKLDAPTLEILLDGCNPLPFTSSLFYGEKEVAMPIDYLIRTSNVTEAIVPQDYLSAFQKMRGIVLPPIEISPVKAKTLSTALDCLHPGVSNIFSRSGESAYDLLSEMLSAQRNESSTVSQKALQNLVQVYNLLTEQRLPTDNVEVFNSWQKQFIMSLAVRVIINEMIRYKFMVIKP